MKTYTTTTYFSLTSKVQLMCCMILSLFLFNTVQLSAEPSYDCSVGNPPWKIVKTNWSNGMTNQGGQTNAGGIPCLEFLPNEYKLYMALEVAVADPTLSGPDIYIGIEFDIPSQTTAPSVTQFVFGPVVQSALVPFEDDNNNQLYKQTFNLVMSFDDHCPSPDAWIMTYSAALLKINPIGGLIPYRTKDHTNLFPPAILPGYDVDGVDLIYTEDKIVCCPQAEERVMASNQSELIEKPNFTIVSSNENKIKSVAADLFQLPGNDVSANQLNIFAAPNPFSDELVINYELIESKDVVISIFDANGKQIKYIERTHSDVGSHQIELNLDFLNPGIYFCRVYNSDGFYVKRLLKL